MTVCSNHDSASLKTPAKPDVSTLVELLRERAIAQGAQIAYRFLQDGETESGSLTYQEIDRRARAIAHKLQSYKATGARVLLIFPPGLDFITAFFGCLYAGAIAVPAYPPRRNQSLLRLQTIINSSGATFALTTSALLARIVSDSSQNSTNSHHSDSHHSDSHHSGSHRPRLSTLHWMAVDAIESNRGDDWQPPSINPQALAFIQYTSGSTGNPKGVMVSHYNILHNSALIQQSFCTSSEDIGVSWLPPYHDMGLIGCILQPVYAGASTILMPPLAFLQQPIRWLQAISNRKATTSGGPNFAYDLCTRKVTPAQLQTLDLSSWQVAFTGAEPIRAATLDRFADKFESCGFRKTAFHPCYGMAETTLIVSGGKPGTLPTIRSIEATSLKENTIREGIDNGADNQSVVGCGEPLEGIEVAIVNPKSLSVCLDQQVGEVWVKSKSVARGYWDNSMLTQKTFGAWLLDQGDRKGPYLRTGDLGFVQSGELFITGRIKDLMIVRGQNHYPQDVEATIESCNPALRAAAGAVFTLEVSGEEKVVVVQEVKRSYLRKLDPQPIISDIKAAITRQHGLQVHAIALIKTGSISKTSSGKIRRHACRSQFLESTLKAVGSWSENPRLNADFVRLSAEVNALVKELR